MGHINHFLVEQKVYKKRRKRKAWKKELNRFKNLLSKNSQQRSPQEYDLKKGSHIIIVPTNFSLIENTNGVLEFTTECKKVISTSSKSVFFDFSKVEEISPGAMSLILSITHDFSSHGIGVSGGIPKNQKARDVFEKSGFLEFFKTTRSKSTIQHNNTILVKGGGQIDQISTAPQVSKAMLTVFGKKSRNQKLQGMLIELMTNTINHAFFNTERNSNWYLSIFHVEDENKVKFCFIDNGHGIVNTINMKFFQSIQAALSSKQILTKAFDGEYGSRTGLSERGTGLIMIKNNFNDRIITNLKVITNNLFYDFDSDKLTELNHNFEGTFYFWELDTTCKDVNY